MFVVIALMVGVILFTAISAAALPLFQIFHENNSQIIAHEIAAIQEAVSNEAIDNLSRLYDESYGGYASPNTPPLSVNSIEHRSLYFLNYERYKYRVSRFNYVNTPTTAVQSHRFAVWFESPFGNFLGGDYTKADSNKCGTGDFSSAQTWCGDSKSLWAKLESHTGHYELIQSEQQRLYRLSRKFYRYYEETGSFNEFNAGANALANVLDYNSPVSPANCTGVYFFKDIPLGCQDLFNGWGQAIYLHKVSDNHIVLTNSLGIKTGPRHGVLNKYVGLAEEINIDKISLSAP